MARSIPDDSISRTTQVLLQNGAIDREIDTAVLLYDLDVLTGAVGELKSGFPATAIHAIAVKANPLTAILQLLRDAGCGFEVASLPELELARSLGTAAGRIVFDSPAKTLAELRAAIDLGCHINIDSFAEIERIDSILNHTEKPPAATFGIRINPQVGAGRIEATSVAGDYSKFGIPLLQEEKQLTEAYLSRPWLTGVHLHIGSQGCPVDMLLRGCSAVHDYIEALNRKLDTGSRPRVSIFDIGGGLPVSYHREPPADSLTSYAAQLSRNFPALFSDRYSLITEFGRHIHANAGWVLSRVEYVKPSRDVRTAILHVGADMFLRTCYRPDDWHHDVAVLDSNGRLKSGPRQRTHLAGPLCFSGDFIARDVMLPEIEDGDYIAIRDAGAYTFSMWSRYNSRQMPLVLGYHDEGRESSVIRHRERVEDVVKFWGPNAPA